MGGRLGVVLTDRDGGEGEKQTTEASAWKELSGRTGPGGDAHGYPSV